MSDNSNIVSAHCVIYFKNFTNSPFNTISKVNSSKLYTAALFVDFAFLYLPFRIVRTFGPYRLHAVHRCGLATVDVACAQSVCMCVSLMSTTVSCTKTAERIAKPFRADTYI